jgi:hypothetical protein
VSGILEAMAWRRLAEKAANWPEGLYMPSDGMSLDVDYFTWRAMEDRMREHFDAGQTSAFADVGSRESLDALVILALWFALDAEAEIEVAEGAA